MLTLSFERRPSFGIPSWRRAPAFVPFVGGRFSPAPPLRGPEKPGPGEKGALELVRLPQADGCVRVTRGPARTFRMYGRYAARPGFTVEDRSDARVIRIDAPGALPRTTDVVWDERERRLVVGVWAGVRPGQRGAPHELAWYQTYWLPHGNGHAARATVKRGTIEITVPCAGAVAGICQVALMRLAAAQ